MSKYRNHLPQLGDGLFLTDGGMETTFIFHDGIDLPHFASFDLLKDEAGLARVIAYYERYIAIARRHGVGVVLESPTWRANADWAARLGYDRDALANANRLAIEVMAGLRTRHEGTGIPMVISGNIGPRGDGYVAEHRMRTGEARDYHAEQIRVFAGTEADMVSAFTINYVEEAIGVTLAARDAGMPAVISFTVETSGCLPTGQSLGDAIVETDAATGAHPAYYMINCAHPTHFAARLAAGAAWRSRIRGLRANASRRSHAELDACTELDTGNPVELGEEYRQLRLAMPQLAVLGGCCGTDHRHVEAIFAAVA